MRISWADRWKVPGPASEPDRGPIKVLYIGGLGRSGSTLLDRMIGQLPGFFSSGEIRDLWQRGLRENRLCGCGTAFRDCPFWSRVGHEAFGGWDQVDPLAILALARSVDRHRYMPLLASKGPAGYERRLERYASVLSRLYRAIHTVSGGAVIVDSSKDPSTAYMLRRLPDMDLRVVHLLRDPRGVAYSWTKLVARPDVVGRTVYMYRFAPSQIGFRWVGRNLLFEVLARMGISTMRVRYETLVESPRAELERILSWYGVPAGADLDYISDGQVVLGMNHTVMGNPVRMVDGPLQVVVDEEWKSEMGRFDRGIVTAMTWALLPRYGYPRNGGGSRTTRKGDRG
jgi:hypothetical protein